MRYLFDESEIKGDNLAIWNTCKRTIAKYGKLTFKPLDSIRDMQEGIDFVVYEPNLAFILHCRPFQAIIDTDTKQIIDSTNFEKYVDSFRSGFEKGREYFKNNYEVLLPSVYSHEGISVVSNLKEKYHQTGWTPDMFFSLSTKGWKAIRSSFNQILYPESIHHYGYYSGILFQLEEWADKHPKIKEVFEDDSKESNKHSFSNLQWAAILYYVDSIHQTEGRDVTQKIKNFAKNYNISSESNLRNNYYKAKNRINQYQDFPIEKLKLIMPFMKENYPQAITLIENDISFLNEKLSEY